MPKRSNGFNGVPSKRREAASDQNTDKESRSNNSRDYSYVNDDELSNPTAILATTSGALQRLANIAQYFESSFNHDVNVVEGAYREEMDREHEIRRLTESLETLTYVKSEEMDNLRYENEKLRAEQEDCREERKRYHTMQAELEVQNAAAEIGREELYKRKLQEEKEKSQKQMKVKRAEIEAGNKKKVQELEEHKEELAATNEDLKMLLSAAKGKLETKKTRHAQERKTLEGENEKLYLELKQVKSEFPVEVQPVQYYAENFRQISDAVKALSSKYFQMLPERAMTNPETVHQELSKLTPVFDLTPIWHTDISEFLRLRHVQHIISTCLCDVIWQPFFLESSLPNHQEVTQFLDTVSKSLSGFGGRSESAWRALTLRGIDALGGSSAKSNLVESTMYRILETLRPLTVPSESAELEKGLVDIVKSSATLWKAARNDEMKIMIEKRPDLHSKEKWHAEDIEGFEEAPIPPDETVNTMGIQSLCLFPTVLQTTTRGETVVLHQGSALFARSRVWVQGMLEKKEHEQELAKAVMDARSKVNARRTSFPTGPNSPTEGKFSKT